MSALVKLAAARLAIFMVVAVGLALLPISLDPVLGLAIALVVSMLLSVFLLRRTRNEVSERLVGAVDRRRAERADPRPPAGTTRPPR